MPIPQILSRPSWWRRRVPSDAVLAKLTTIDQKQDKLMSLMSDLLGAVAAEKNETLAARMAINGLSQQLANLKTQIDNGSIDTAAVQQAINELSADAAATAAAIPADGVANPPPAQPPIVPPVDTTAGAAGNDTVSPPTGSTSEDTVTGNDTILGHDTLGNDSMAGNDSMLGNDSLSSGNDSLPGNDSLSSFSTSKRSKT